MLNILNKGPSPTPQTKHEFVNLTLSALKVGAPLALGFHILLSLTYLLFRSDPEWIWQLGFTLTTTFILAITTFFLNGGHKALTSPKIYPFTLFLFLLPILSNQWINFYLTQNNNLFVAVGLITLLSGYLMLETKWFSISLAVSLIGWITFYQLSGTQDSLTSMVLLSLATGLGAWVFHIWRHRDMVRMSTLGTEKQEARQLAQNLHKSGQAVAQSLNKQEVLVSILDNLTEILPCNRASVMLKNGDYLDIVATLGFPPYDRPNEELRVYVGDADDDGIFPQICHSQMSLHIESVPTRADWVQLSHLAPAEVWLGTPLIHNKEVVGMFSITRVDAIPYTAQEIEHAELFASQAAVAVQNALLYERVTHLNHQMEAEVLARTKDLQDAYVQLEKLDQAKTDFIGVMSHELRTPLTVLSGYAQILAQYEKIKQDDVARDLVDGVRLGAVRLQELVNSLLDMVKLENDSMEVIFTEFAPVAACQIVMNNLDKIVETRHLEMRIDQSMFALPPIVADYELIQKVLQHLLLNAVKYTPDGGLVEIKGCTTTRNGRNGINLIIRDTGIGIDKEVQEVIFEKFYQTGKINLHSSSQIQFKGGGAGLGLPLAKGIIGLHGGEIWVESDRFDEENLPGSEFHIWLPHSAGN